MTETLISTRRLSPAAKAGLGIFARYATIIGLAAMIVAFSALSPDAFPTFNNFINVINQASLAMIISGGLTLALVIGEMDLSVGYAASLHGVLVTGLIVHSKLPIPVALAVVIALGGVVGAANGLIVTKLRVNSVIATLGVGTILVGLAFAYSSGVPIVAGVPEDFLQLALGPEIYKPLFDSVRDVRKAGVRPAAPPLHRPKPGRWTARARQESERRQAG